MGVHPERGAAVRMSKPCGHADDIRAVRDGKTGRRVAQLVRMKMVYQRLYRKITNNADAEAYRDWIKAKSKDILAKLAHKGYNIYEISNYAKKELQKKKPGYDEAYTEYRTKRYLTR